MLFFVWQTQIIDFAWSTIEKYEVDDEAMAFCFLYRQTEELIRWVKIFTPYVSVPGFCPDDAVLCSVEIYHKVI